MNKYVNMRSISNIKARMKIAMFYFLDIVCLFLTFILGQYIQDVIQFKFGLYVTFQITNLLLCLVLCLPSPNNPNRNNFSVFFLYMMKDKRQFLSSDFKFIKRMRKG